MIRNAFCLARNAHEGQWRRDGSPYFFHPFRVALLVAQWGLDEDYVAAALLHDVLEDAPHKVSATDIIRATNQHVLTIVKALTKPPKNGYSQTERIYKYHAQLIQSAQIDRKILLVKFADRLDNLRSLYVFSIQKQVRIASETIGFYIPLAYEIGYPIIGKYLKEAAYPFVTRNATTCIRSFEFESI